MIPALLEQARALLVRSRRLLPLRERRVRVLDAIAVAPGTRLAVVAFGGRELLVSVAKTGVTLIAEDRPVQVTGR